MITLSGATFALPYKQLSAPNAVGAFAGANQIYPIPEVNDLWVDTTNNVTKRCTSTNPYTWVSIESGGGSINFSDSETPGGAINSANTAFTLAHVPSPAASLNLYLNGVRLIGGGVDYTLAGSNITMVVAPTTGDSLVADYRY